MDTNQMEKYPLRSSSLKNFLPAFLEVQKEIKSVEANKSGVFTYADLNEIMEALRPAINKNGISISHSQCFDVETQTFLLYTQVIHISDEFIASLAPIIISRDPVMVKGVEKPMNTGQIQQAIGIAISYQARYSTKNLFAITIEDDPDDNNGDARSKPSQKIDRRRPSNPSAKLSEKQINLLNYKIETKRIKKESILSDLGVKSFKDLAMGDMDAVLALINSK